MSNTHGCSLQSTSYFSKNMGNLIWAEEYKKAFWASDQNNDTNKTECDQMRHSKRHLY